MKQILQSLKSGATEVADVPCNIMIDSLDMMRAAIERANAGRAAAIPQQRNCE